MSGVGQLVAKPLLGLVWLYRKGISPLLGANCRFEPSCSAYAEQALREYGGFKGGWLALALSLAIVAILFRRAIFGPVAVKIGVVLVIVSAVVVALTVPAARGMASASMKPSRWRDSFRTRSQYWHGTVKMFPDFPVKGSGLGTFGSIYAKYKIGGSEETRMAHNNYLQVLTETGIIGLLAFLWLWVRFLSLGWKKAASAARAAASRAPPEATLLAEGTIGQAAAGDSEALPASGTADAGCPAMVAGAYAGVCGFLAHSLVDFDFYVPGITLVVWALMGVVMGSRVPSGLQAGGTGGRAAVKPSGPSAGFVTAVVAAALLWMIWSARIARSQYLSGRSVAAERAKDLKTARATLQKATAVDPRRAEYHFRLGQLLRVEYGRTKEVSALRGAVESLEAAVKHERYRPFYHASLSEAYWALTPHAGRQYRDKAVAEAALAVSCYPTVPRYHIQYGRILQVTGRKKEALAEYETAFGLLDNVYRRKEKLKVQQTLEQVKIWMEEIRSE